MHNSYTTSCRHIACQKNHNQHQKTLAIGGTAIVQAYVGGQSIATALSASGGLIMLPIAAVVLTGTSMHRMATSAAETWLKTSEDWMRAETSAGLLNELQKIGPGESTYSQRWATGNLAEQMVRYAGQNKEGYQAWEKERANMLEGGNNGARYEITKAYVALTSLLNKATNETEPQFKKRFDTYISDQMIFLYHTSQGTFDYAMGPVYEHARTYATYMAESRALQSKGETETFNWTDSEGNKQEFDLAEFANTSWQSKNGAYGKRSFFDKILNYKENKMLTQLSIAAQLDLGVSPEQQEQIIAQKLTTQVQDDLLKLDAKIVTSDLAGWEITGGEEYSRTIARFAAYTIAQQTINTETKRIQALAKNGALTREEFQTSIATIKAKISETPAYYYQHGTEQEYITDGKLDPSQTDVLSGILNVQSMLKGIASKATAQDANKETKQWLDAQQPLERAKSIQSIGDNYLISQKEVEETYKNAFDEHPDYYEIDLSIWSSGIYVKFVKGKWCWKGDWNNEWLEAGNYKVNAKKSWSGNEAVGKMNKILSELDRINKL